MMERSFWTTIRGKLLSRTLVVALIPMLALGVVAIASLGSLSNTADESLSSARSTLSSDVVGTRVAGVAEQVSQEIAIFFDERLTDVEIWASDTSLVAAAAAAAEQAAELGLADMTIEEAEALFDGEPRLGDEAVQFELRRSVRNTPAFKEIFITDVNGFNVDYSSPTSDFVQNDEAWWTEAMADGLDISQPEFDASAGVFAVDIAIRLEGADGPVGVLKTSLDLGVVQTIADRSAGGVDELNVTIVEAQGRLLAETATRHDVTHIMNSDYVATDPTVSTELVRQVFAPNARELHPNGHAITADGVGGFAHVDRQLAALRGDMSGGLSAFDWNVVVEQPADVAFAALQPLEGLADEVASTSSSLKVLLLIVAIAGVLAAAGLALIFGRALTAPIARLRDAAEHAAEVTLPNVVAQIDELEADEELPELEKLTLQTGDEVEDLAHSFNTVQQTAADLASQQARMRRKNVATTFVNLGRRNQNLLARQLEHINSMESEETNSATLERLFQLDHLATRMRRNAESLLVLAGEETPRRFRQPVSMHQVLQAAGGEIEDFSRIELTTLHDAQIEGSAASDVAHLLAELLENASTYSPPGTVIQVHGRRRESGYRLAIIDQGIGMEEAALAESNNRLSDPDEFDRAPSAYLGHFVVGHLAKRHGIQVQLTDSPYGGVAAQLHIPAGLMVTQSSSAPAPAPAAAPAPAPEIVAPEIAAVEFEAPAELDPVEAMMEEDFAQQIEVTPDPISSPMPVAQTVEEALPPVPETVEELTAELVEVSELPAPPAAPEVPAAEAAAEVMGSLEASVAAAVEIATTPIVESEGLTAEPVETTPSGFRRRRPGQEGAPKTSAPTPVVDEAPAPARRSPDEVKASLQRFRQGVEAGRAESGETTIEQGNLEEGDAQ